MHDVTSSAASGDPLQSEELPKHLAPLVPAEWAVWRWFVLRGAGFAAETISRLSEPWCASAADQLLTAEAALKERYQAAIRIFNQALDSLSLKDQDAGQERLPGHADVEERRGGDDLLDQAGAQKGADE